MCVSQIESLVAMLGPKELCESKKSNDLICLNEMYLLQLTASESLCSEASIGCVLLKKFFLKISQNSQKTPVPESLF